MLCEHDGGEQSCDACADNDRVRGIRIHQPNDQRFGQASNSYRMILSSDTIPHPEWTIVSSNRAVAGYISRVMHPSVPADSAAKEMATSFLWMDPPDHNGPHFCVGAPPARLQAGVLFTELMRR